METVYRIDGDEVSVRLEKCIPFYQLAEILYLCFIRVHQLLEKVTVLSREKIQVTFRDGREIEQVVNQPKRRCITA